MVLHILSFMRYLMPWTDKPVKWSSVTRLAIGEQGGSFLTSHCHVNTTDLSRQANAKHCYSDVIFVDCPCSRKLVQNCSSQVNGYRFYHPVFTTWQIRNPIVCWTRWLICLKWNTIWMFFYTAIVDCMRTSISPKVTPVGALFWYELSYIHPSMMYYIH